MRGIALILAALALLAGAAFLGAIFDAKPVSRFDLRSGSYAHNVYYGFIPVIPRRWRGFEQREDEHFGVVMDLPRDAIPFLGSPGLDIGGTFNTESAESMVHAAAVWRNHLFWSPLFFEGTFGGGLHDGHLLDAPSDMRNMACRFNFYESIALGLELWGGVSVSIAYEHMSNAEICMPNEGLSNAGWRIHWAQ